MNKLTETLAKNMIQIRKAKKLTQELVAERSGVSIRTIQSIENQTRWPGMETLEDISSKGLGVSVMSLFHQETPEPVRIVPNLPETLELLTLHLQAIEGRIRANEDWISGAANQIAGSPEDRIAKIEQKLGL